MNSKALFTLFVCTSMLASVASADSKDFARNKGELPVVTKTGDCVLTKWQGADGCGKPAPAPEPAPAPAPAPVVQPEISYENRVVYFDFNKSVLTPEAVQKLDGLIATMAGYTNITKAEVRGYADIIGKGGKNDHNLKLSQDRAFAVRDYIASRTNIPVEAMGVTALGDSTPFAKCDGIKKRIEKIECLGPDRRVEIEFRYLK